MTDAAPGGIASLIPLVWRELLTAVRTPALWIVVAAHVAVLAAYMVVWGDGIPVVGARPVLEQFVTAQWVLLAVVLPWAAARCGATKRRDEVALLAAQAARRPSNIVAAVVVGLGAMLVGIACSGLPFVVLAQQVSARPAAELWSLQWPLAAFSVFIAAITTACMLMLVNRLLAWALASAIAIGSLLVVPPGAAGGFALLAVGAVAATLVIAGADTRCRYVSEWS